MTIDNHAQPLNKWAVGSAKKRLRSKKMSDKEILCEVRDNLDVNIKYIVEHIEPTDYYAGRKSAFEDIARMIDALKEEQEYE